MIGEVYDGTVIAVGCALVALGAFTVVTGRWPRRSSAVPRPRWKGVWAVCLGLVGLAPPAGPVLGGPEYAVTLLLAASVVALVLSRAPPSWNGLRRCPPSWNGLRWRPRRGMASPDVPRRGMGSAGAPVVE